MTSHEENVNSFRLKDLLMSTESSHNLPFLEGVIAPMLTPVHSDGSLDLTGAASFIEWLISRRCVRSVFARSGMGKMFTFTVDETKHFGETVVKAANGKIGVLIGSSGEWTTRDKDRTHKPDAEKYLTQAVELTLHAEKIGANAAVHVMPEAYVPRNGESIEDASFRYFQTIHDAAKIPLVIYQPGGIEKDYQMTPALLRRLIKLPRIAGMKVSTADDHIFGPLAEVVRTSNFALIAGNENYFLRAMEQGAVGVIGEGCNVYPEILESIRVHYLAGHLKDAERAQADVPRALELTHGYSGTIMWKQVLKERGVKIDYYDRNKEAAAPSEAVLKVDKQLQSMLANY